MNALGPIGVFDSGVGGLTVVAELRRKLPTEDLIYFGDTARVPYGIRSADVVREFSLEIGHWLVSQGVKAIVIACNTVSSVALDDLRRELPVPVLGVIDAGARMAVAGTSNGRVAVIGTSGTIASGAYPRVIASLNASIQTWSRPCPLFVPLVEEGLFEGELVEKAIEHYLKDLPGQGVDTLVLGCTHYPLLKRALARVLGSQLKIVDAASGVADELSQLLMENKAESTRLEAGGSRFVFSDRTKAFRELAACILPDFTGEMELIHVESDAFLDPRRRSEQSE
jgi:glutamate racemase